MGFPLAVGTIPTIAPYLLPRLFPILRQRYPRAQLHLHEQPSQVLVDRVREGSLDVAILALPFTCEGLLTFEFHAEDFYWIVRRDQSPFDRGEIRSEELAESNLMLLEEGHCLKDQVLDVCRLTEPPSAHHFGASSLTTLIQMVLGGYGSTLVPQMALSSLVDGQPDLVALHLDEPGPHRRLAMVIRPGFTRMGCMQALLAVCQAALSGAGRADLADTARRAR